VKSAAVTGGRRRVRIALVAVGLLGGGAIALAVVLGARASGHGRPRAGQNATVLGPFRVGEEVRSHAKVTVRLDLGRGAPPQEMELEGEWRTTVTDVDGGLASVACQLADLRASAGEGLDASARQAETGAELARELGQRFFVSQRADGSVYEIWLPRAMKPAMANILLTLVGEAQLVRPAQAQPAWIIQERDVNGAYLATYQETAPGRFHKQKARYLEVAADARAAPAAPGANTAGQPHIQIDRSDIDLVAASRGRLLELRADDATTVGLAGLSFNVTLRFTLAEAQVMPSPFVAGGTFAREKSQFEPHPMAQLGLDPAAEEARRDRTLLGGASADILIAELRALRSQQADTRAASTLVARWEALLRLELATAARIPALVLGEAAQGGGGGGGKVLVDALSGAGTDQAQAALAAIAADPAAGPTLRMYAIQYLGLQRSPAPAGVAGLRALLDDRNHDLAETALLALGACAHNLRATAPDRTRELVGALHTRLARATDPKTRQDLVVALGNAGDPSSLPVLRALIENKDAKGDKGDAARTSAIEALRFISDPAVDPLLGGLLGRAGDTSARFAAISAIRFRDVGPFTAQLAEVARHDPAEHIRRAAIDLLGSHVGDLPTLLPLLEELAHSDPDSRNRELAARYLTRG
jgi:hypothetical protein